MTVDFTDIKTRVAELAHGRDRTGKPPLTKDERIQILNECLDGSLIWLKQSVLIANAKGVGAATMIIERCRLEINELQRAGQDKNSTVEIHLNFLPGNPAPPDEGVDDQKPIAELRQPVGPE